jgi:hypothetical protein
MCVHKAPFLNFNFSLSSHVCARRVLYIGTNNYLQVLSISPVIIHCFCEFSNEFINICAGSFSCEVESAFVHGQSLLILEEEHSAVQVRTFQGTIKQMLPTSDIEGRPIGMELCGSFLTVATAGGWIKIWDLSRRYGKWGCLKLLPKRGTCMSQSF